MDDRFRRELSEMVVALAERERERLAAAGTFVEIEELTAEIGDEVTRQLANLEFQRRSDVLAAQATHACPDCDRECPVSPEPEPIILKGVRGEIEYTEPRCHCTRCRRDFFPSGRPIGASAARERHAEGA
jgi:hypothetical protein